MLGTVNATDSQIALFRVQASQRQFHHFRGLLLHWRSLRSLSLRDHFKANLTAALAEWRCFCAAKILFLITTIFRGDYQLSFLSLIFCFNYTAGMINNSKNVVWAIF